LLIVGHSKDPSYPASHKHINYRSTCDKDKAALSALTGFKHSAAGWPRLWLRIITSVIELGDKNYIHTYGI